MKKIAVPLALIAAAFVCSCSKDNTSSRSCDFSVAGIIASADGQVKYEAEITGSATISQVLIKSTAGVDSAVTISGNKFQTTLSIKNGTAIGISAKGNASSGGIIEISYEYQPNGGGALIKNEEDCGD